MSAAAVSGLDASVLVLNRFFQAVHVVTARRAFALLCKEAAEVGWATKSVPADELEEEVNRMASSITLLPRDGIAIGKASNHMILDILGYTQGWTHAYVTHTMLTNMKYAPGEFVWVKQREETGTKTSFHDRDKRFKELQ